MQIISFCLVSLSDRTFQVSWEMEVNIATAESMASSQRWMRTETWSPGGVKPCRPLSRSTPLWRAAFSMAVTAGTAASAEVKEEPAKEAEEGCMRTSERNWTVQSGLVGFAFFMCPFFIVFAGFKVFILLCLPFTMTSSPRQTNQGRDCMEEASSAVSDEQSSVTLSSAYPSESVIGYAQGTVRKAGALAVKNFLVHKKNKKVEFATKRKWKQYWVSLKGAPHTLALNSPFIFCATFYIKKKYLWLWTLLIWWGIFGISHSFLF